ncbi:MAG: hypothetical protein ACTS5I_15930, partial [Rhodanobacter sp.]
MTATVPAASSAAATASRTPAAMDNRGPASASDHFERQFSAAKQQVTPTGAADKAPVQKQTAEPSGVATATVAPPPPSESTEDSIKPAEPGGEADDAAAALAGAMLALLGPAVTAVLRPVEGLASAAVGVGAKAVAGNVGLA